MTSISIQANSMPVMPLASIASRTPDAVPQAAPTPSPVPITIPTPDKVTPVVVERDNITASLDYDNDIHQFVITLTRLEDGGVVQQFPSEAIISFLHGVLDSAGPIFDGKG